MKRSSKGELSRRGRFVALVFKWCTGIYVSIRSIVNSETICMFLSFVVFVVAQRARRG